MSKDCNTCGTQELRLSPSGCIGFGRLCPHMFEGTSSDGRPYFTPLSENPVYRKWIQEHTVPRLNRLQEMMTLEGNSDD